MEPMTQLAKEDAARLIRTALHIEALSKLMQGYAPDSETLDQTSVNEIGRDLQSQADAILDVLEGAKPARAEE